MPFDAGIPRSPADLLDQAIGMIIRRENWCQSTLGDGQRHCAVGALVAVTFGDGDHAHLSQYAFTSSMSEELRDTLAAPVQQQVSLFRQALGYLNRAAQRRGFDHIMRLNDARFYLFLRNQHRFVLSTMREAAATAREDQPVWTFPLLLDPPTPADAILVS